jgi:hypothetical protein
MIGVGVRAAAQGGWWAKKEKGMPEKEISGVIILCHREVIKPLKAVFGL